MTEIKWKTKAPLTKGAGSRKAKERGILGSGLGSGLHCRFAAHFPLREGVFKTGR